MRVTEIKAGDRLFESRGYTTVKVSTGDTAELRIPIKSTGITRFQEKIQARAPVPPTVTQIFDPDTPIGRQAGLVARGPVMIPDLSDKAYIRALDEWTRDFKWLVVIYALDVSFTNGDGGKLTKFKDIKAVLQDNGITSYQLDQMYSDVVALTKWTDERNDFL